MQNEKSKEVKTGNETWKEWNNEEETKLNKTRV
jgi:hypothetical protein